MCFCIKIPTSSHHFACSSRARVVSGLDSLLMLQNKAKYDVKQLEAAVHIVIVLSVSVLSVEECKVTGTTYQKSKSPPVANFSEIHSGTSSSSNFSCSSTSPTNTRHYELSLAQASKYRKRFCCLQLVNNPYFYQLYQNDLQLSCV